MQENTNQVVALEVENDIAIMFMDGCKGNIMNEEWLIDFNRCMAEIETLSLKGLIITGRGRNFCSGVDFMTLAKSVDVKNKTFYTSSNIYKSVRYIHAMRYFPFPVIAAIKRVCIGSGLELALACHYRLCDKSLSMGSVEVDFNMMPGMGGSILLPELIDRGKALELILKGEIFSADKALELGLVDEIVPPSELLDAAKQRITRLHYFYQNKRVMENG